jgi:hypothetical protein
MQGITTLTDFPKLETCWLTAPDERDPLFLPVFAHVSLALQTALRERVPGVYFADLRNYHDVKKAYPLLIYQASRPFRVRIRTELTYDFLNPEAVSRVARSAKSGLGELLSQAEGRLREAGWLEVAENYKAKRVAEIIQSVQSGSKSRKCLHVMIRDESVLMNALVALGGLRPKEQARRAALFEKRWSFQLRRLYAGTDFMCLAPVLLGAATQALWSARSALPQRAESDSDPGTE